MLKQVLVIEDDFALQKLFQTVLNHSACEVVLASGVDRAWDYLHAGTFDFVICDIHVEGGTTLDIMRFCQENQQAVVAVSSNDEYINICRDLGAKAFFLKPIAVDELITLVDHLDEIQEYRITRMIA